MAIEVIPQKGIRKIHKNLFFDEDSQSYAFIDGQNRREVVSQESYLMIYILEMLKEMNQ